MGSNYRNLMNYNVDLVFCIDSTMSMVPFLDTVKERAINMYSDLMAAMNAKGKKVNEMRVRVISFRDYLADREKAMLWSDFYTLPAQSAEFDQMIRSIEPEGGGDDPEDGLEALYYAIRSEWNMSGVKRRHVIVIWTDDGTHELGYGKAAANYPRKMAKSFSELSDLWGNSDYPGLMEEESKRLVLYAPEKPWWTTIVSSWNNVVTRSTDAGNGISEYEYEEIIGTIVNSI